MSPTTCLLPGRLLYLHNFETAKLMSGRVHVPKYMHDARIDLYHFDCSTSSSSSGPGESSLVNLNPAAIGVSTGLQSCIPALLSNFFTAACCSISIHLSVCTTIHPKQSSITAHSPKSSTSWSFFQTALARNSASGEKTGKMSSTHTRKNMSFLPTTIYIHGSISRGTQPASRKTLSTRK